MVSMEQLKILINVDREFMSVYFKQDTVIVKR